MYFLLRSLQHPWRINVKPRLPLATRLRGKQLPLLASLSAWHELYAGSMQSNARPKMHQYGIAHRCTRLFQGALVCILFMFISPAHAEIFKYLDAKGNLYITDQKMEAPYRFIASFKPWSPFKRTTSTYNPEIYKKNVKRFLPHIQIAAQKHSLDPMLLHAIVDTESSFNPRAKSKSGAIGLMQLMPKTAMTLGVQNSLDPQQNIAGGALYMRQLLDMFDQNIILSVAAYNAGQNAVIRAGRAIPDYPETKRYVKKVMKRYLELQQAG